MKWTIPILCFFFLLGNEIFAQDKGELESSVDYKAPTQDEDIPVLTDIIVVPSIDQNIIRSNRTVVGLAEQGVPNSEGMLVLDYSDEYAGEEKQTTEEDSCEELLVYPNPAKDYTNLALPNRNEYNVYLYDMAGNKKAYRNIIGQMEERLDLGHLSTGTYLLQVVCGEEIKTLRLNIVK